MPKKYTLNKLQELTDITDENELNTLKEILNNDVSSESKQNLFINIINSYQQTNNNINDTEIKTLCVKFNEFFNQIEPKKNKNTDPKDNSADQENEDTEYDDKDTNDEQREKDYLKYKLEGISADTKYESWKKYILDNYFTPLKNTIEEFVNNNIKNRPFYHSIKTKDNTEKIIFKIKPEKTQANSYLLDRHTFFSLKNADINNQIIKNIISFESFEKQNTEREPLQKHLKDFIQVYAFYQFICISNDFYRLVKNCLKYNAWDLLNEVYQETITKLPEKLFLFNLKEENNAKLTYEEFTSWSLQIAKNKFRDQLKNQLYDKKTVSLDELINSNDPDSDTHIDKLKDQETDDPLNLIANIDNVPEQWLDYLPKDMKVVATCRIIKKMSYQDIATELNKTYDNIVTTTSRIRDKLSIIPFCKKLINDDTLYNIVKKYYYNYNVCTSTFDKIDAFKNHNGSLTAIEKILGKTGLRTSILGALENASIFEFGYKLRYNDDLYRKINYHMEYPYCKYLEYFKNDNDLDTVLNEYNNNHTEKKINKEQLRKKIADALINAKNIYDTVIDAVNNLQQDN